MASFIEMMTKARSKAKDGEKGAMGARFKEILGIITKYRLFRDGVTPDEMVSLLQELGPTFVKLGQIASTHPDVLPLEYCTALGSLRTKALPMDYSTVVAQVESELGKPLSELFSTFDEEPSGSASIAQVHRAVLPDGKTEVAVKVQRPGVVETVTSDLAILERIVDLYDLVSRGDGKLSLNELVGELVRTSTDELDFTVEAHNLDRFYENNHGRAGISSPKCYSELTCPSVLTEDFFSAPCIERIDELGLSEITREQLGYLIARNYMQQVMEDGFYHADPHAGNILVLSDEDGTGIQWIDFGMMGVMTSQDRERLSGLVSALVKGDAYGLKRAVLKVATPKGAIDHGKVLTLCEDLASEFADVDLENFDTGALVTRLSDGLKESGFEIDPFLVTLGRGLVTLEGTIHLVSPKLNIMQVLNEYAVSSFDPSRIEKKFRQVIGAGIESAEATVGLPTKASDTLDMLQRGQVKIGLDLDLADKITEKFSRELGSFSLALIAAALIIGSCILTISNVFGSEYIGTGGFVLGFALAIYVSYRVLKR